MTGNITDRTSEASDAYKGVTDALGSAPGMIPEGGRWLPSLTSALLPTGVCNVILGDIAGATAHNTWLSVPNFRLNICPWAGTLRAVLEWAVGITTIFGVWFILFRS